MISGKVVASLSRAAAQGAAAGAVLAVIAARKASWAAGTPMSKQPLGDLVLMGVLGGGVSGLLLSQLSRLRKLGIAGHILGWTIALATGAVVAVVPDALRSHSIDTIPLALFLGCVAGCALGVLTRDGRIKG